MAAKKQVKKIKIDYLKTLKAVTKYITNKNRNDRQLNQLIDHYKLDKNIIKRVLSYNLHFPHLIYYYNKYLNGLYDYNKLDLSLLLKSITHIMDINNVSDQRGFLFLKSNEFKDDIKEKIKNLFDEYLRVRYNIHCSKSDLRLYYKLFKLGIITDEELLTIDRELNNDDTVIKNLNFTNFSSALAINSEISANEEIEEIELSENIIEFINSIEAEKANRKDCNQCELKENKITVLDTNGEDNIDICFIGPNPSFEKDIKNVINKLDKSVKWLSTSIILCEPKNKVKDIETTISNCNELLSKIVFEKFDCKLFIAVGDDCKNLFGIQEPISKCSGKLYELEGGIKVIPLINPSSASKNPKFKSIFEKSVNDIIGLFNTKPKTVKTTKVYNKIEDEKLINEVKDLLFVDTVRLMNNQIMFIYTDRNGEKKYKISNFEYPIKVKRENWDHCPIITDKTSDECIVNDYQKSEIIKKSRQILKEISVV